MAWQSTGTFRQAHEQVLFHGLGHHNIYKYIYIYIYKYVYIYMSVSKNRGTPKSSILIGFSIINHPFWGTPIFGNIHMPVTNEGFLEGFPTKNGIFLLVTVTGWGIVPRYICICRNRNIKHACTQKNLFPPILQNHILQEPNVMATNLSPLHNCSIEIAWYNSTGENMRQSSRCLPMRQTRTAFNTLKSLIDYHHYDTIPPHHQSSSYHHHHHHQYYPSQDHFPTTPYLVVSCKFI